MTCFFIFGLADLPQEVYDQLADRSTVRGKGEGPGLPLVTPANPPPSSINVSSQFIADIVGFIR